MKSYEKNHPRPQLFRPGWENLNGSWDFSFDDINQGEKQGWARAFTPTHTIQVPFTYETKLSGIEDESQHPVVWYQRSVIIPEDKQTKKVMLHFEGSDYFTKVWVNGKFCGSHRGGYARFSFDITEALHSGENSLVVRVEDSKDPQQPRGKQRWTNESYACWYVQTTGIWKTVWLEYVPENSIEQVKMTPNLGKGSVDIDAKVLSENYGEELLLEASVSYQDQFINKIIIPVMKKNLAFSLPVGRTDLDGFEWNIHTWTPENPNLYDISFRLLENQEQHDAVYSYFGMREIAIQNGHVLLNGQPIYQRLILDQGYWKDSHITPPDEEALLEDIDKIKMLGYNGLRKHQKTEDERFLYWCDVKGMLVWSEFPAAYQFSDYAVQLMTEEWMQIVRQNYNHPSIIVWTPFNESWGIGGIKSNRTQQHLTEAVYHLTKTFDPMRPVVLNDGWEHTCSDIITLHDYEELGKILRARYENHKEDIVAGELSHNLSQFAMAKGFAYKGQPILISEYGGIAFQNDNVGWGYGNKVNSQEDFIKRFDDITTAVKEIPYICGFCYTQVSDVQQEINGLMDEERNFKIAPEIIKEINERKVNPLHKG
ncbi:glycoside hydrolase family 2 protein [Scatolibacter rhodanostii]|uniref:glycoside hydrolase family 2 protein n=1 Tax=Scatolibacter rhodanostii TaxID=2014781 RepID=UPI000C08D180|nr:sugar-binding domain-containing protein [Scatolibacter rhodanostii]